MFIRGSTVNEVLRAADDDGGGNSTSAQSTALIKELRAEAKDNRLRAQAAETEAATLKAENTRLTAHVAKLETDHTAALAALKVNGDSALEAARAETAKAVETAKAEGVAEATTAANGRIVLAELKAEAIRAGMVDPDGLKLLDTSKVALVEDGTVKVPDGFFDEAKKAKPWLFGATPNSTSSTSSPPKPGDTDIKLAKDMTDAERAASLRAMGVRV